MFTTNTGLPAAKSKAKIDLLTELDNLSISAPTLQPMKSEIKTAKEENLKNTVQPTEISENTSSVAVSDDPLAGLGTNVQTITNIETSNSISIASTIPSKDTAITVNSTLESTSTIKTESHVDESLVSSELNLSSLSDRKLSLDSNKSIVSSDTSQNATYPTTASIENFIKEVQRFEKSVNILTTKTLNGTTPLETKWKELHDLLVRINKQSTISTIIARTIFICYRIKMLAKDRYRCQSYFLKKIVACCMSHMITQGYYYQRRPIII